jgi:hypothetical protein
VSVFLLAPLLALQATAALASDPPLRWDRQRVPGASTELVAVASGPAGSLAVADARGVLVQTAEGWQRHAVRGDAADLAFDARGVLWIAGSGGLVRLEPGGRAEDRSPGVGERDRHLGRISIASGILAVAGEGGAFVSPDGRRWSRPQAGLPTGAVKSVLLLVQDVDDSVFELWLSAGGRLYRVPGRRAGAELALDPAERVALRGRGARSDALDLVPLGRAVLAIGADWVAVVAAGQETAASLALELPAGARARRGLVHAGRTWLASDRGLLVSGESGGAWTRVGAPADVAMHALARSSSGLVAAGARGLVRGAAAASPAEPARSRSAELPAVPRLGGEPDVRSVQRAALAYLDLGPERLRDLRRGVDRRGWLPKLDLRAGGDLSRDRRRDFDQAFLSGGVRDLFDEEFDRGTDVGVSLVFSWDLGDTVFHPDALDVSREARALIELRDDVLDEVTRLYFERRRVLLALAAGPGSTREEAARLRLRADELAAGLDAWTGGWFGRRAASLSH